MSDSNTILRLDKLSVQNFRCFGECSIDLHPTLTVLFAENAEGKTALLDAVSIALDVFVQAIAFNRRSHGFNRKDVHLIRGEKAAMIPVLPVEFKASGYVSNESISWSRSLTSYLTRARSSTRDTKRLRDAAKRLRDQLADFGAHKSERPPTLPLAVFYGTGRLWSEQRLTQGRKVEGSSQYGQLVAYMDCLSSSSSFKAFVAWYEAASDAARSPTSVAYGLLERPVKQIAAVRQAVRTVLEPTSWTEIDWEFAPTNKEGLPEGSGFLVVEHPERGRFPVSLLSDGVRNMVALAGDLAHRCARLNPHLGEDAAAKTPGVLLIDEVDMHLHPRWQQLVVALLQKAFPSMQMIFSTHSPHVLSTVAAESIREIQVNEGHGLTAQPGTQTKGTESASVLASVMRIDPVPPVVEAKELSRYRQLIQLREEDTDEGQSLRQRLDAHFGRTHPLMLECDRLIRLERFKAKLPTTKPPETSRE
jgi:predicted ATP-binding protein involved in virulence